MLPGFIPGGRHMAEEGRGSTQNSALHFPLTAVGGCQDLALKFVCGDSVFWEQ